MSDKPLMSRDIVVRLRDPSLGSPSWMDTMEEAAAEIERLRAEVTRLRADRRERIAAACLAGLLSDPTNCDGADDMTATALRFTDALIAKLEAKP